MFEGLPPLFVLGSLNLDIDTYLTLKQLKNLLQSRYIYILQVLVVFELIRPLKKLTGLSKCELPNKQLFLSFDLWHLSVVPAVNDRELVIFGDPDIELHEVKEVVLGLLEGVQSVVRFEATSVTHNFDSLI